MKALALLLLLTACGTEAVLLPAPPPPPSPPADLAHCPAPIAAPDTPAMFLTPQRLKEAFDAVSAARVAERRRGDACAAKLELLHTWIKAQAHPNP